MGRDLQKKNNRSKVPKIKKKRRVLRNGNKKIDVFGNTFIADNWDKTQTLVQNYRRLGLTTRLNAPTGGVEKPTGVDGATADRMTSDSLFITGKDRPDAPIDAEEIQVERDPETGKIIRLITDNKSDNEIEVAGRKVNRNNPLSDPINDIEHKKVNAQRNVSQSEFIRGLEMRALQEEEEASKKRRPRQQSKREEEWIERLVARHGENVKAMVRDRKLNPMQQTEGDIQRRIHKWQAKQAA